jgi:hypothetical protein
MSWAAKDTCAFIYSTVFSIVSLPGHGEKSFVTLSTPQTACRLIRCDLTTQLPQHDVSQLLAPEYNHYLVMSCREPGLHYPGYNHSPFQRFSECRPSVVREKNASLCASLCAYWKSHYHFSFPYCSFCNPRMARGKNIPVKGDAVQWLLMNVFWL